MGLNKQKIALGALIVLLLAGALLYLFQIGWFFGYGTLSQPVATTILNADQNFDFPPGFPPDPGASGKQTIQGMDADQDGVRDDVQRWIYAFVPKEPNKQMALRQMARCFQVALDEEFGPEMRKRFYALDDRAIQCMNLNFGFGNVEHAYVEAKVMNTYGRVKHYWENNSKIHALEVAGDLRDDASPCDSQ